MNNEDFERIALQEEIYLEEKRRHTEAEYWEWYRKSEGTVLIIKKDGTTEEVEETTNSWHLPF